MLLLCLVQVDEEGTEAAAATAVIMMRCAMPRPRWVAEAAVLWRRCVEMLCGDAVWLWLRRGACVCLCLPASLRGFTPDPCVARREEIELRFDRPFVFAVVHRASRLALFCGEVHQPEAWKEE